MIREFCEQYGFGNPVAGNYYIAQYDHNVEEMRARILKRWPSSRECSLTLGYSKCVSLWVIDVHVCSDVAGSHEFSILVLSKTLKVTRHSFRVKLGIPFILSEKFHSKKKRVTVGLGAYQNIFGFHTPQMAENDTFWVS